MQMFAKFKKGFTFVSENNENMIIDFTAMMNMMMRPLAQGFVM